MRASEFITEVAYDGNIGMSEVAKFYMVATPEQKKQFKAFVAAGDKKAAWKLIKDVTGDQLIGSEFATESKHLKK